MPEWEKGEKKGRNSFCTPEEKHREGKNARPKTPERKKGGRESFSSGDGEWIRAEERETQLLGTNAWRGSD